MLTPDLLRLLRSELSPSPHAPAGGWTHAGERITPAAHVVTEREVRAGRQLAAQAEAQRAAR